MKAQDWPRVRLGDHVDLLSGFAFKSQTFTDDPNDIPLVKGANVHQGFIDWVTAKRWPANEADEYERFRLRPGDVVVAMDRPWIEAGLKYAWIKPSDPSSLLVQRVARLRGVRGLDTGFLRFVIGSEDFTNYIKPIVTGVNVPHISGDQIRAFEIRLPPLLLQKKVSAILSPYDDLIANNARRIEVLEEMAQSLYREWFVNFRYRGHQQGQFDPSPLGRVPQGWRVKPVSEVIDPSTAGVTPSAHTEEEFAHFSFPCHDTDKLPGIEVGSSIQSNKFEVPDNCLLVSKLNPRIERIWVPFPDPAYRAVASTEFIVAVPKKPATREFLYGMVRSPEFQGRYISRVVGTSTSHQRVKPGDFFSLQVVVPPPELIAAFTEITRPMLRMIHNRRLQTRLLRQTRYLLLPKLIAGELDVEHLDIDTGDPEAATAAVAARG
jgi:type I restriction enzyme S subunit